MLYSLGCFIIKFTILLLDPPHRKQMIELSLDTSTDLSQQQYNFDKADQLIFVEEKIKKIYITASSCGDQVNPKAQQSD